MKQFLMRFINVIIGLFLYAFGIVLMINANIGYAPWEVFHVGLSKTIGWTIGFCSIIAGIIIVIIVWILGEKPGFGTIASMILTGIFIDIIIFSNIIPKANNLIIGIVMIIAGLFIIAFGSYFYIKSAFGVGPRDNLMVVLARRTKLPVGLCRCIVELLVTTIGWILGGMVGIGTIIAVISIGFCIQIIFKIFKFDITAVEHETFSDTFKHIIDKQKQRDGDAQ
jgi:uncharacterized membrane protein YczE